MVRALVYAHHDRDGVFDPHVVAALQRYRPLMDHVTVVSTAARQLPAEARPFVDHFLPRDNIGYDFCSWRAGLDALGSPDRFDEIVCANDSVYGPLFDVEPAFTDPRVAGADLWGMCLSHQGIERRGWVSSPHVQSWWFVMRKPLLASSAFASFWNTVQPLADKEEIIDRYEIGMSEQFASAGFHIAGLYDAGTAGPFRWREFLPHLSLRHPLRSRRHIRRARRIFHNPSELVWRRLLNAGVPFVKVALFRVNEYALNLDYVLSDIRGVSPFHAGLIRAHLQRVGPLSWTARKQGPFLP